MLTSHAQIIHNAESHQTHATFVFFSYLVFNKAGLTWFWISGVCGLGVSGAARRRRDGVCGFSFKIFLERSLIFPQP